MAAKKSVNKSKISPPPAVRSVNKITKEPVTKAKPVSKIKSSSKQMAIKKNNLLKKRTQISLARDSALEAQEKSRISMGVPTKDLAAKAPKDLPKGYNKDRIIDGLKIKMLTIDPSKVEMLVFSDLEVLTQKIGRLKSRTATLLSFEYPETYVGKGTWGKGFWYSNILNKEDLAIAIIKDYRLK